MKRIYCFYAACLLAAAATGIYVARKYELPPEIQPSRVKGPLDAPIVIDEYTDLQCPACRVGNEEMNRLFSAYGRHIRLTFRHSPLPEHKWAVAAAGAAECAGWQNKFFQYADMLYQNQDEWSKSADEPAQFDAYAVSLGINRDVFSLCMRDPSVRQAVEAEARYAAEHGIDVTPTFIVNGKPVRGARELAQAAAGFEALIRRREGL
ncbi:MAG: thioredoxin domain-containing protein [Elusimicrobiales bacterium]